MAKFLLQKQKQLLIAIVMKKFLMQTKLVGNNRK